MNRLITLAIIGQSILLTMSIPAAAQSTSSRSRYVRPQTVIGTPFSYGGTTIYRDARTGRSVGSSMPLGDSTIYRSNRPWK